MKKRFKLSPKKSRKQFSNSASGAHPKNYLQSSPMRGGIRL